jgi:hypothetical protein
LVVVVVVVRLKGARKSHSSRTQTHLKKRQMTRNLTHTNKTIHHAGSTISSADSGAPCASASAAHSRCRVIEKNHSARVMASNNSQSPAARAR